MIKYDHSRKFVADEVESFIFELSVANRHKIDIHFPILADSVC